MSHRIPRVVLRPVLLLLLVGIVYALLASEAGLRFLFEVAARHAPGELRYQRVEGRLIGPLTIEGLHERLDDLAFDAEHLTLDWRPLALLRGRLEITDLALDRPRLRLPAGGDAAGDASLPALPLAIVVDGITLRDAELTTASGEHIALPHLALSEAAFDGGHWRLALDWRDLQWPLSGTPDLTSREGRLTLEGEALRYRWQLKGGLEAADRPALALRGQGTGHGAGLVLDALDVATPGGRVQGSGRFDWTPEPRWEITLATDGFDPGPYWPDGRGALTARIENRGRMSGGGIESEVRIARLTGRLRDQPLDGAGVARLAGDDWAFEALRLDFGTAQLRLDGRYADQAALKATLRIADLGRLLPGASGSVKADAAMNGPRSAPRLALDLAARGLRHGEQQLATLDAHMAGTGADHRLRVTATDTDRSLSLHARGGYLVDRQTWRGSVLSADWTLPGAGHWALAAPTALTLDPAGIALREACWRQDAARLCLAADAGNSRQNVRLALRDLPLAQFIHVPDGQTLEGTASLAASLRRDARGLQGEARLDLSPAALRVQDSATLGFGPGSITARLDGRGLSVRGQLPLAGQPPVELDLDAPGYQPGLRDDPPLRGQLTGALTDLAFLEGVLDGLKAPRGQLRAVLRIAGTLLAPRWTGRMTLTDGSARLDQAGIELTGVEAELATDDAGALQLAARAHSGDGVLGAHGSLLPLATGWEGRIQVDGRDFLAFDQRLAEIYLSPALDIAVNGRELHLGGMLEIPRARFTHEQTTGAVLPTRDAVIAGREAETGPFVLHSDLNLRLGKDVRLEALGLRGRVEGGLRIHEQPGRVTTGHGELTLREATYKAHGQNLAIEQGRLLYQDTPLDEPDLDLRAVRRDYQPRVGLRVQGPLDAPVATLFSEQAMPQSDMLSHLLLGRPLDQTSGEQGRSLALAAGALGLTGGSLLAERIAQGFGLDELSFSGSEASSAGVTIGKYLTPRLYLSYGSGLLDAAEGLFRLRFKINQHWSLQTESGSKGTGGDVLYTYER